MLNRGRQRWRAILDDNPLAGLINLFDLWMVFSIALLLALVGNMQPSRPVSGDAAEHSIADLAVKELEPVNPAAKPLKRFRPSDDELIGEGERLGTAFRLKSGEVVYVPEAKAANYQFTILFREMTGDKTPRLEGPHMVLPHRQKYPEKFHRTF